MDENSYIIVPIKNSQIIDTINKLINSRTGIQCDDFAWADAKVFDIAAKQIRFAYVAKKAKRRKLNDLRLNRKEN